MIPLLLALQVFPANSPILLGPEFYAELATETCVPDSNENRDMMVCAHHAFVAADAKLNETYKRVIAHTKGYSDPNKAYDTPDVSKLVVESQRSWLKLRDDHCLAIGTMVSPGHEPALMEFSCMTDLTNQRISQLEQLL